MQTNIHRCESIKISEIKRLGDGDNESTFTRDIVITFEDGKTYELCLFSGKKYSHAEECEELVVKL